MPSNRLNTDPWQDFLDAWDRYVVAKETPGVPSEFQYHAARHARQRLKREEGAA